MAKYVATCGYRCIRLPNSTEHHVEAKYDGSPMMWIVPGTYRDDPAFEQAGAMASYARAHRTHYWLGQYPR